jgi:hypothetical protein
MSKVVHIRLVAEAVVLLALVWIIALLVSWGRAPSGTYVDTYLGIQGDAYWKLEGGKAFLVAQGGKEFLGYYSYSRDKHCWIISKRPRGEPSGLLFPSPLYISLCDTNNSVIVLPRSGFAWAYR